MHNDIEIDYSNKTYQITRLYVEIKKLNHIKL